MESWRCVVAADMSPSGRNILKMTEALEAINAKLDTVAPSACRKHGNVGVCMDCLMYVVDYRLSVLSRDILKLIETQGVNRG